MVIITYNQKRQPWRDFLLRNGRDYANVKTSTVKDVQLKFDQRNILSFNH